MARILGDISAESAYSAIVFGAISHVDSQRIKQGDIKAMIGICDGERADNGFIFYEGL